MGICRSVCWQFRFRHGNQQAAGVPADAGRLWCRRDRHYPLQKHIKVCPQYGWPVGDCTSSERPRHRGALREREHQLPVWWRWTDAYHPCQLCAGGKLQHFWKCKVGHSETLWKRWSMQSKSNTRLWMGWWQTGRCPGRSRNCKENIPKLPWRKIKAGNGTGTECRRYHNKERISLDRFQYKGYSDQYHVYRQYASAKGIHYRPDYQTPKEE